jgi:hypothetical protein
MGWLGRKTSIRTLESDIKRAKALPEDQRVKLSDEMEDFIEEIGLVMQTPDHDSELMRLFQSHGANRKALASGGFSAEWAHHAFRESYLLALIKAPKDSLWFEDVHKRLSGPHNIQLRKTLGALNLYNKDGEKHGVWEDCCLIGPGEYHRYFETYKNGVLHGPDETLLGDYYHRGTYKNGELDGPYEAFGLLEKDVDLMSRDIKRQGTYIMGEKHGEWVVTTYSRDSVSQPASEPVQKYWQGNGGFIYYLDNTDEIEIITYMAGSKHGPYSRYETLLDHDQSRPLRIEEDMELKEKGTYNMGEKCGEWLEDGETVTYDPCPLDLEGGN